MRAVDDNPQRRWSEDDLRDLGYDPSTVRRHFKKHFGMTFLAYSRARRMGEAVDRIEAGGRVIEAQLDAGYESGSGFREAFGRLVGARSRRGNHRVLYHHWIETPLGTMVAVADDKGLYLLEFADRPHLERDTRRLLERKGVALLPGKTEILNQIEGELDEYFCGIQQEFETPTHLMGTEFQREVWEALQKIPYGATWSYSDLARELDRPQAVRAVGAANGANRLVIAVPCHRVVGSDGKLTGYRGGLARKRWLLEWEENHSSR